MEKLIETCIDRVFSSELATLTVFVGAPRRTEQHLLSLLYGESAKSTCTLEREMMKRLSTSDCFRCGDVECTRCGHGNVTLKQDLACALAAWATSGHPPETKSLHLLNGDVPDAIHDSFSLVLSLATSVRQETVSAILATLGVTGVAYLLGMRMTAGSIPCLPPLWR
jgi:hypothetical protein